jgi:hypothetical protein
MASSAEPKDVYRQHLYNAVIVKRTRLRVRNREVREWSLVVKRDIRAGEFIGFYTGATDRNTCPSGSLHALDMGPSQPCIVPFANEDAITPQERDRHPLACMNEPSEGEHANCHMAVQDFTHDEIENVAAIQHNERAAFFRGLACFACVDIPSGTQLTWWYGNSYEPHRQTIGYVAGYACKRVLENEVFVQDNSRSVLQTVRRVPSYCVWPVLSRKIKSSRFKKMKRTRVDSEGEESDFSSGSDHEEAYKPRRSRRRVDGAGPS